MSGEVIVVIFATSLVAIPLVWLVLLKLVCPPRDESLEPRRDEKRRFSTKLPNSLAE
jgi:hypothetical protein